MKIEDLKECVIEQIKQVKNQDTLINVLDVLRQSKKISSTFEGLPDFDDDEITLADFRNRKE